MTNVDEPQARARRASPHWEVWCPIEDVLYDLGAYARPQDADAAAASHNASFTPPHTARSTLYIPDHDELLEKLTGDQLETLQKAALLVIGAREEAATLLTRAGAADVSDDFFGEPVP
ncbi:hypothetical protein SGLAM104S_00036 [Streptomyces glaucescens]